jgi:hypothetical protein
MKVFQKFCILLLSVIFLFGTIGITIYEHTCLGKPGKEIVIYPEFFSKHADCCCAETGFSANPIHHSCKHQSVSSSECCRNISLFLNASIISLPVSVSQPEIFLPVSMILAGYAAAFEIHPAFHDQYFIRVSESPPLSGQKRILLFHQSRTESPSDHLS